MRIHRIQNPASITPRQQRDDAAIDINTRWQPLVLQAPDVLKKLHGKEFDIDVLMQLMRDLTECKLEVDDIEALYRHRRSKHG
jgi:hypothetical protein